MASGDFIIAKATPRADEINLDAFVSGEPMPAIRYFVPAYNSEVEIRDAQGGFVGVKTPRFSEIDEADENSHHYYPPFRLRNLDGAAAAFDDFDKAQDWAGDNHVPNILKHRDPDDDSKVRILRCDIKPEQVIKESASDSSELKIILEKRVNGYKYDYLSKDADGNVVPQKTPRANVFYILDEEHNVIAVVHAFGFTFLKIDKWEIVQQMIYRRDAPIRDVAENPDPFYFKTASEILLPQVIIGDDADRLSGKAGATIGDFDRTSPTGSWLEEGALNDQRALFLETAPPLDADVERSENNIRFDMESPKAALYLNGHALTLSGAGLRGRLNIVDSGAGKLIISGDNADLRLTLIGLSDGSLEVSGDKANLEIVSDNDSALKFVGFGVCALNGRLYLRKNSDDAALMVDGKVQINGDGVNAGRLDIEGKMTADGIESSGTIKAQKLEFNDSEAFITGGDGALHFNDDKASVSGDGDISGRHITAEGKFSVKAKDGASDSGDAEIEGALRLTGSQNMDLGGNSLVNCRTISELFKDGLVWFNGEYHYAQVPDHHSLNFSESFTFLMSFRTDKDYRGGDGYLLNKGRDADEAYYRLYLNTDNCLVGEIKSGGLRFSVESNRAANDGRIHTALVRCDRDGYLELYLDGIKADASDIHGPSGLGGDIKNDRDLFIATDGEETPGRHFQGEMFLARVWKNLLSEEEALEFSSNPQCPFKGMPASHEEVASYLAVIPFCMNDISKWHSSLTTFQMQSDNVNNSFDAFKLVAGSWAHNANLDLIPMGLQLGKKYRLEFDVKHIGYGSSFYGGLTPGYADLFKREASTLFYINSSQGVAIFPSGYAKGGAPGSYGRGSATYGAVIETYPTTGFQRLAFEFEHTANTNCIMFEADTTSGGIYLDNIYLSSLDNALTFPSIDTRLVDHSHYLRHPSMDICLELSAEGLGETDRWLDRSYNQLHGELHAEFLTNARHAGDLEITGDLKVKTIRLVNDFGDDVLLDVKTIMNLADGLNI